MPGNPSNAALAARCNATVAVMIDANSTGGHRTRHAGVPRDLVPVDGMGAVRVVLGRKGQEVIELDGRRMTVFHWAAMFTTPVSLDVQHCLVWNDPDNGGAPRYLYVAGRSANAFLMNHHWFVPLVEYVRPVS